MPASDGRDDLKRWRYGKKPWHRNKGKDNTGNDKDCLTSEDADAVAGVFQQLIQGYTLELTNEALTEDFVDYSSAVNIIRNRGGEGPLVVNAVTFSSREEFSAGHGRQPNIPFDTLGVWHGCNTTSVRWQTLRSGNGQPSEQAAIVSSHFAIGEVIEMQKYANHLLLQPVVGIAVLETIPDEGNSFGWRIKTLYSEFNSAAWLVNNGVFTPNSTLTPPPADKRDLGYSMRLNMP